MFKAVKLDSERKVVNVLDGTFNSHRECLNAARSAFGKAGGLMFQASRVVVK